MAVGVESSSPLAGDGTWDRVLMVSLATVDADGRVDWSVSVDATINRAHQHATQPPCGLIRTQGAGSNYMIRSLSEFEPAGHGIGRSWGGATTKIHTAVGGLGRPLAVVVTGGQRNDGAMLSEVLDEIVVPRHRGRAHTRPHCSDR